MIYRIYRHKRRAAGRVVSGRTYRLQIRLDGQGGAPVDVSLRTSDKRVAEQAAAKIREEMERERAGLIPPRSVREGAAQPLTVHLREFLADLRQRGRDGKYCDTLEYRLEKVIIECGWRYAANVSPDSFTRWRSNLNRSPKTGNDFLGALSGFLNWMVRQGRIASNPLAIVGKAQVNGNRRRERRAFSDDELRGLLAVAGPRAPLYLACGINRAAAC